MVIMTEDQTGFTRAWEELKAGIEAIN